MGINFEIRNAEYVFKNIKVGDVTKFYHDKWHYVFSHIIYLFTKTKIDHDAIITAMQKSPDGNVIYFTLAEMRVSGIKKSYSKIAKENEVYTINIVNHKNQKRQYTDLYYSQLNSPLNEDAVKNLAYYVNQQCEIKSKYNFLMLPFTVNWIAKKFSNEKIRDNIVGNKNAICTSFILNCHYRAGIISEYTLKQNILATPEETAIMPYLQTYKILK